MGHVLRAQRSPVLTIGTTSNKAGGDILSRRFRKSVYGCEKGVGTQMILGEKIIFEIGHWRRVKAIFIGILST
jgi:hypothetical protein